MLPHGAHRLDALTCAALWARGVPGRARVRVATFAPAASLADRAALAARSRRSCSSRRAGATQTGACAFGPASNTGCIPAARRRALRIAKLRPAVAVQPPARGHRATTEEEDAEAHRGPPAEAELPFCRRDRAPRCRSSAKKLALQPGKAPGCAAAQSAGASPLRPSPSDHGVMPIASRLDASPSPAAASAARRSAIGSRRTPRRRRPRARGPAWLPLTGRSAALFIGKLRHAAGVAR